MKKVCVAMSGGVDSSVAATLLKEQGYDVMGAFMKNWSLEQAGVSYKPWEDEAKDAEAVCRHLGIPFEVFDFEQDYQKRVVDAFVGEYEQGRTPNPDVLCNREIKFDLFLRRAQELGAEMIATGHYAQIEHTKDGFQLCAGADPEKDQSYFLYTLTQKELPFILFPIGHLHKHEVRNLARKYGLPNADKKDSQGVCFIGPVSMRQFLQHYLKPKPGDVVTSDGRVIGQHDGVIFYTEGQRHGFDTGGSHSPLYVAEKRLATNELVVVPEHHSLLQASRFAVDDVTWTIRPLILPRTVQVRVRYRQALAKATLQDDGSQLVIRLETPIRAVSSGQSAVFYDGGTVLGGGVITQRLN